MFFVACSVKTGGVGVGAQEENSEKSTVNAQEKGERDNRGVHELMFYLKIKHFEY